MPPSASCPTSPRSSTGCSRRAPASACGSRSGSPRDRAARDAALAAGARHTDLDRRLRAEELRGYVVARPRTRRARARARHARGLRARGAGARPLPKRTLERGYAIAQLPGGAALRSPADAPAGTRLLLTIADGPGPLDDRRRLGLGPCPHAPPPTSRAQLRAGARRAHPGRRTSSSRAPTLEESLALWERGEALAAALRGVADRREGAPRRREGDVRSPSAPLPNDPASRPPSSPNSADRRHPRRRRPARPRTPARTASNQTMLNLVLATAGLARHRRVPVRRRGATRCNAAATRRLRRGRRGRRTRRSRSSAPAVPADWYANAARITSEAGVQTWKIGFVTGATRSSGSTRAWRRRRREPTWVDDAVDGRTATGTTPIDGVEWNVYDHRDEPTRATMHTPCRRSSTGAHRAARHRDATRDFAAASPQGSAR